ncbi:MAG: hypothetical protein CL573_09975 [Alphaproteobacteria bacterium]|nr:hypothetical protein [Alphaproteobacteria bacterium]HCP00427.1 hypothetical protein [Rhodospirillaceae bacterium]|tara:strand:+ start:174 stop:503 length:330 start_codon:yes stop_codon:yes gene_type:complete
MIIGRIIGWLFLIAALAVLARDLLTSIGAGSISLIATGELWFHLHQTSLQIAEPAIARHIPRIGPWLWHPIISTLLTWPALFVLSAPGFMLCWLFRIRRRTKQVFNSKI